jgi:phospho-N-acetylmuramoyl-pentapeptide-transferase
METVINLDQFNIFNVVRIFGVGAAAFALNIIITHFWLKVLRKHFTPGKEIEKTNAPIFMSLHKKKEGTPTMGGLPIWVTVAFLTGASWIMAQLFGGVWDEINFLSRSETLLPLGFLLLAGSVGFADDVFGILKRGGFSMRRRLFLYTVVALLGAWWFYFKLGRLAVAIPFLGTVFLGWWYIPFFVLVIVASAFSANETDGLDGLAGGIFMTVFGALAAITFDQAMMDMTAFIAAIMGALVGFLWFNIYPAKFFMGDTGVMALGFTVGCVAMLTDIPFLLPVIAIIFFAESLSVIVQMISKKVRNKKIFFSTPIHHHFEALGWPETQITMRFWMINALGAVVGLIIFLVDSKIKNIF